jgi:hypothetical protein
MSDSCYNKDHGGVRLVQNHERRASPTHIEPRHDTLRALVWPWSERSTDVWRDVGDVEPALLVESSEVIEFMNRYELRDVINTMRSRALELFHQGVGALFLSLDEGVLWLHLEYEGHVADIKQQDDEFLEWFVSRYPAEVTERVQFMIDFVES